MDLHPVILMLDEDVVIPDEEVVTRSEELLISNEEVVTRSEELLMPNGAGVEFAVEDMMAYDVIIAGAGPVGLFLACELRLAKLSVLVLEAQEDPSSPLK